MRISVDPDDPGYEHYPAFLGASISVDGVVVLDVVTADDSAGEVICFPRSKSGNFILSGDEILRCLKTGRVEIILPEARDEP